MDDIIHCFFVYLLLMQTTYAGDEADGDDLKGYKKRLTNDMVSLFDILHLFFVVV